MVLRQRFISEKINFIHNKGWFYHNGFSTLMTRVMTKHDLGVCLNSVQDKMAFIAVGFLEQCKFMTLCVSLTFSYE